MAILTLSPTVTTAVELFTTVRESAQQTVMCAMAQGTQHTADAEPLAQEGPAGQAAQAGTGQGVQAGADGRQTAPGSTPAPDDRAGRRAKEANPLRSLGAPVLEILCQSTLHVSSPNLQCKRSGNLHILPVDLCHQSVMSITTIAL